MIVRVVTVHQFVILNSIVTPVPIMTRVGVRRVSTRLIVTTFPVLRIRIIRTTRTHARSMVILIVTIILS